MSLITPDLIEEFCSHFHSKHTIRGYRSDLHFFHDFLQQKGIKNQWQSFNLDDFVNYIEEKSFAENSKRRKIQSLRVFFDFLIKKNQMEFNPLKEISLYKKILRVPEPPSFEKIEKFYQILKNQNHSFYQRNLVIFQCIYELALQPSDFSSLFRRNLHKDYLLIDDKNHQRYLPLSVSLSENLHFILKEDFESIIYSAQGLKFIDEGLKERSVELFFKEVADKVDFEITPKSLRQACIVKWFQEGKNKTTIASYLGIKDPQALNIYESLKLSPYKQINVLLTQ